MTWKARNQRKCYFCHNWFWPRSSGQRVCDGQECRDYYRTQNARRELGWGYELKEPRKRKCIICGKFFTDGKTRAQTCSIQCRKKNTRNRNRENQVIYRKRHRNMGTMYELRPRDKDGLLVDGYGNSPERREEYKNKCLTNPEGGTQWVLKAKYELTKVRKFIKEGCPKAAPSPTSQEESKTPNNSWD